MNGRCNGERSMRPGPSGSKMKAAASAVSWCRAGSGRRCSRPFVLDVPFEVRVERLVRAYGRYDTDRLVYRHDRQAPGEPARETGPAGRLRRRPLRRLPPPPGLLRHRLPAQS